MAGVGQGSSWNKVIAITVAACVAVGGLLWLIVPKGAPTRSAAGDQPEVRNELARAGDRVVTRAGAESAELARGDRRRERAERLEERLGKPPRLSVQISNPLAGSCRPYFSESMVVRAIRGDFTDVVAELKLPQDKTERSRVLMEADGEWTGTVYSIPVNTTAHLYIRGTGPGGLEDVIFKDISYSCSLPKSAQDPLAALTDDTDGPLLGDKAAGAQMREKMFDDDDFEFDFDYEAPESESADKISDRPTSNSSANR